MGKIFLGLVHHPVYNKKLEVITTSIANLDIHDIARSVATYGVEKYYLIHPLETQQQIIAEILRFWQEGYGAQYNPDRKIALEKVSIKKDIDGVVAEIENQFNKPVKIIVTDAREYPNSINYLELREKIETCKNNYLLLFGTGWGMHKELMNQADYRLLPIKGLGEYNHLSVRSAVAIILDRLCGEKWW